MNTKSRKSDPPQAMPISTRAKEGRVPPRLRYEQSEEHPSDIPDSIRVQGPPNFLGLTYRIPEGSPKVACVNHVLATPHHPEPFQEDTSPPHLGHIDPSCHLVSWQHVTPPHDNQDTPRGQQELLVPGDTHSWPGLRCQTPRQRTRGHLPGDTSPWGHL